MQWREDLAFVTVQAGTLERSGNRVRWGWGNKTF